MIYKIKAMRVGKGIKQKDFAKQLGITIQYLGKIERGNANPTIDIARKIAILLDSTIEELFF